MSSDANALSLCCWKACAWFTISSCLVPSLPIFFGFAAWRAIFIWACLCGNLISRCLLLTCCNVSGQLVNWMEIKIHAVQNNSGLVAPTTALAHVLGQNSKAEWRMTIMERLVMNIGGWGGGCMGAAGHSLKMRHCASSTSCRSVSVCRCCELVLARGALSDRASRCQPCEHQDDCIEMCQTTRSLAIRSGCMQQDLSSSRSPAGDRELHMIWI